MTAESTTAGSSQEGREEKKDKSQRRVYLCFLGTCVNFNFGKLIIQTVGVFILCVL